MARIGYQVPLFRVGPPSQLKVGEPRALIRGLLINPGVAQEQQFPQGTSVTGAESQTIGELTVLHPVHESLLQNGSTNWLRQKSWSRNT